MASHLTLDQVLLVRPQPLQPLKDIMSNYSTNKIDVLSRSMGVSGFEAAQALSACNWDLGAAADYLRRKTQIK